MESSFLESELDSSVVENEGDKIIVFENCLKRLFHHCQV